MNKFTLEIDFEELCYLGKNLKSIRYRHPEERDKDDLIDTEKLYLKIKNPQIFLNLLDKDFTFDNLINFIEVFSYTLTGIETFKNSFTPEEIDDRLISIFHFNQLTRVNRNPYDNLRIAKYGKEFLESDNSEYLKKILDIFPIENYSNLNLFLILKDIDNKQLEDRISNILQEIDEVSKTSRYYSKTTIAKPIIAQLLLINYIKTFIIIEENAYINKILEEIEKLFINNCNSNLFKTTESYISCIDRMKYDVKLPIWFVKELIGPLSKRYKDKPEFKVFIKALKTIIMNQDI